jgi:transposase InsO family protein
MRGRYGVPMNTFGTRLPGAARIARVPVLSKRAKQRLAWMDWYERHERNARRTCRHFGITPDTFYHWKRRYDPRHLYTLEERSRRPRRVRPPMTAPALVTRMKALREQYPRWGPEKLAVLLRREGWDVSPRTVGRRLRDLRRRGLLVEPKRTYTKHRGLMLRRPHAAPKPWDFVPEAPGDLVEVDTLSVTVLPGIRRFHFSARDVVSKWDVAETSTRKTSRAAARLLDALQERMPVSIRGLQIDGGSEFKAVFERECQRRRIPLYVLPPKSPRLNGCVERSNGTWRHEFYGVHRVSSDSIHAHRRQLQGWERTYNTIRPHQALGYLTPAEFLLQWKREHPKAPIHLQKVYGMY